MVVRILWNAEWLADHERDGGEWLRDLCLVPTVQGPVTIGFEVKRQDRVAGCLCQPDGAWLGNARRTAGTVEGEACWPPSRQIARELSQRPVPSTRGRAPRGSVAKALDD